jgi:ribosomal protein S18 acetylase RimI-like enzyme
LLTEAFLEDPLFRVVLPEMEKRRRALGGLNERVLRYTMLYGEVLALPGLKGVSCWLPPGGTDLTAVGIIRSGLCSVPLLMGLRAFRGFDSYVRFSGRLREEIAPDSYRYLWLLGVGPEHHGKGYGRKLVEAGLEKADADRVPCLLETENERNLDFYRGFGFEVAADGAVPGMDIHTWMMIRRPQGDRRKDHCGIVK